MAAVGVQNIRGDSLSSSDWPRVMMITFKEHLSPRMGKSTFSIQQKMELKQRECEMRRPESKSKQKLNQKNKQILEVSGQ